MIQATHRRRAADEQAGRETFRSLLRCVAWVTTFLGDGGAKPSSSMFCLAAPCSAELLRPSENR